MARKNSLIYVRKDGSKVAVWHSPVGGQLRFVASKRTAVDGKVWWCIFDNENIEYVRGSKYKMKLECEAAIKHKLEKGELPFVPYDDGTFKQGKHKFAVDVTFYKCHCVTVEAKNRKEAQQKVEAMIHEGEITPYTDGFEYTDDFEADVSGEEQKDGEIQYF